MIPTNGFAERHRGQPFVLLGVNNDENAEDARVIDAKK